MGAGGGKEKRGGNDVPGAVGDAGALCAQSELLALTAAVQAVRALHGGIGEALGSPRLRTIVGVGLR